MHETEKWEVPTFRVRSSGFHLQSSGFSPTILYRVNDLSRCSSYTSQTFASGTPSKTVHLQGESARLDN